VIGQKLARRFLHDVLHLEIKQSKEAKLSSAGLRGLPNAGYLQSVTDFSMYCLTRSNETELAVPFSSAQSRCVKCEKRAHQDDSNV